MYKLVLLYSLFIHSARDVVPTGFEPVLLANLAMRPYKDRVLTVTLEDQNLVGEVRFELSANR